MFLAFIGLFMAGCITFSIPHAASPWAQRYLRLQLDERIAGSKNQPRSPRR